MATDFGALKDLVPAVAAVSAAAGAIALAFKGRAKWEPSEEDIPQGAQKVGGLLTAIAVAILWYWFWHKGRPELAGTLTMLAVGLGITTLAALLVYSVLISWLTYDKEVAVDKKKWRTYKIIGGFVLTERAKQLLKEGSSLQQALKGASYEEDLIWVRFFRSLAKATFQLVYIVLVAAGAAALTCAAILVTATTITGMSLSQALERWNAVAGPAIEAGTVKAGTPLPVSLVAARSTFEGAWKHARLAERQEIDQAKVWTGLSDLIWTYRMQEKDSPTQANSLQWAEAAVQHFDQTQDQNHLRRALVEKTAIYLGQESSGAARFVAYSLQPCSAGKPEFVRAVERRPSSSRV